MIDFITVALKNVFSKPATRNYPKVKRNPCKSQRGNIQINIDNCIFCGMCMRKCPVGAIKVDRVKREWSIDKFKCVVCSSCAENCPKKCLDVKPEYTAPAYHKSTETFKGKPLVKPAVKPLVKPAVNAVKAPAAAKKPAAVNNTAVTENTAETKENGNEDA